MALDNVLICTLDPDEQQTFDSVVWETQHLFAAESSYLLIRNGQSDQMRVAAESNPTVAFTEVLKRDISSILGVAGTGFTFPLLNSTSKIIGALAIILPGGKGWDEQKVQSAELWGRNVVKALEFLRLSVAYGRLRNEVRHAKVLREVLDALLKAALVVGEADRVEISLFDRARHDLFTLESRVSLDFVTQVPEKRVGDESSIRQMLYSYRSAEILRDGPELLKTRADVRTCCQIILRWQFCGTGMGFLSIESFDQSYLGEEHQEKLIVLLKAVEDYLLECGKHQCLDGFGWSTTQHSYSLDTLLDTVLDSLRDGYGFRKAILYTPQKSKLKCRASLGCGLLPVPAEHFWYDLDEESAAVHVFNDAENEIVVSYMPSRDSLFSTWGLTFFQILCGPLLITPMMYAERKIGVVVAWGRTENLQPEDVPRLKSFANLAAAAIDSFDANSIRLETFNSLIEKLPIPVFRKNEKSIFTYANPEFCLDLPGRPTLSEVIGQDDYRFYATKDADKYILDDNLVLTNGEIYTDAENNLGREVDVLKLPVRDAEGRIVGLQCVYRPRRFRKLFERAPQGIYQSTPGGRYLAANDALAKMLGYADANDLIKNVEDIGNQVYWEAKDREAFTHELESRKVVHDMSYRARRKNKGADEMVWLRETARMAKDPQGNAYYEGFVQDTTEQRRDAELRMRSENQRVVGEFAAIYGHHLGQPLVSAQNAVQTLLNRKTYDAEKLVAIRESINGVLRAMVRFPELCRGDEKLEQIDLNEFIKDCLKDQLFLMPLGRHNTLAKTDLAPSLPRVLGPRLGIHFAIMTLVQNALDAMGTPGTLIFRTKLGTPQAFQTSVCLEIQDSGSGIAPEIAETLGKEPYRTTKQDGTGLGVYSVRRFMQLQSGDLTFHPNADGTCGTTFCLIFNQP